MICFTTSQKHFRNWISLFHSLYHTCLSLDAFILNLLCRSDEDLDRVCESTMQQLDPERGESISPEQYDRLSL